MTTLKPILNLALATVVWCGLSGLASKEVHAACPDCNGNHLSDTCEMQNEAGCSPLTNCVCPGPVSCNPTGCALAFCAADFEANSPTYTNIVNGNFFNLNVLNSPHSDGDVRLDLEAVANLANTNQYIRVEMNGVWVGNAFTELGYTSCTSGGGGAEQS